MKYTELYEVNAEFVEELTQIARYDGIGDALDMLGRYKRHNMYSDPLLAKWFKQNAKQIANYAVGDIRDELGTAGIMYEASQIENAGIVLPNVTLTWYIRDMMPSLARHLTNMLDNNPGGAVNCMVGLKKYHDIDIQRYIPHDLIARIVIDCIIANNVRAAINALKGILGADNSVSVEYLNAYKYDIIKSFLYQLQRSDPWETMVIYETIQDLIDMGINWPELKRISKSIAPEKK